MEVRKILPDPDLYYGIKPEDTTNHIQKAPQRPRKARRAPETENEYLDTSSDITEPRGHPSGATADSSRNPLKEEA